MIKEREGGCIMSLNAKKSVPLYVQLMDAIRSDIKQGNLNQGDQIPSESELSSQGNGQEFYCAIGGRGITDKDPGKGHVRG